MNSRDIEKLIEFIIYLVEEEHDTKTALEYLKYLKREV